MINVIIKKAQFNMLQSPCTFNGESMSISPVGYGLFSHADLWEQSYISEGSTK